MTRCCTDPPEPRRDNPAGRRELRYRIGTWATFRERMIQGLARQPHSPDADPATADRPLSRLPTRMRIPSGCSRIFAVGGVINFPPTH